MGFSPYLRLFRRTMSGEKIYEGIFGIVQLSAEDFPRLEE